MGNMRKDKYKALFDQSADAILIIEGDRFIDCNAAAVHMLGYKSKREVMDTHPSQLSPEKQPDGRLSYEKANEMIKIAFTKGSNRFEWAHQKADGSVFPVEVLLTAVPEGDHQILHVVWRDITERKQDEKDLLRLKSIIESTSDIVSSATPDGKIFYLNRSGTIRLGKGHHKPLSAIHEFHPGWAYEIIMREGIPHALANGIWEGETAVLDFKNQEVPVSQVIMSHKDEAGRLEFLSTILRDISDRKRSEQFLNNIIANMPACVKLVKKDGTLIDMNPAGLLMIGAPPDGKVMGRCIYDFISAEDREKFVRFNERVCQGNKESLAFTIIDLSGRVHYVDSVAVPLYYGPDNEVIQLGITRDITDEVKGRAEREQLESRLHQAQKMEAIGTLAGGIAHDFNNILSGMLGYAQLAKSHLENREKVDHYLDQVIDGARKAADLVQQILTFSRKTIHEKKPLRIYLVVKEALKLLRASIPSFIDIQEDIQSRSKAMADATKIHQVVMNLCTNAYHAMRDSGGILSVGLRDVENADHIPVIHGKHQQGPYIRLEVRDSGMGMDQEIINKIFEPYFTTKDPDKGTGLGLAVVHGIIEEHQGYITVTSEPGKGSSFCVFLPVTRDREESAPEIMPAEIPVQGKGNILLVDDEISILDSIQTYLKHQGYTVTAVKNGLDALREFEKDPHKFDIIISDVTMPGLTGDILARKALALRPDIPVFLCSGYSEKHPEHLLMGIGIRKFLQKPVIPYELAIEIQKVLAISK